MPFDLVPFVRIIGTVGGGVLFCAALARVRGMRWVTNQLIKKPLTEVFTEQVGAIVQPLIAVAAAPLGVQMSALHDCVDRVEQQVNLRVDGLESKIDLVLDHQGEVKAALSDWDGTTERRTP